MYQIQTQIHVCDVEYADFVLWTEKDIHIERIEGDATMWRNVFNNSLSFFRKAILPELIGKFYSRRVHYRKYACFKTHQMWTVVRTQYSVIVEDQKILITWLGDDKNCKLQWYHLGCLKIKRVLKGKWFCPECRKLSKNKHTKSKRWTLTCKSLASSRLWR